MASINKIENPLVKSAHLALDFKQTVLNIITYPICSTKHIKITAYNHNSTTK